MNFFNIHNKFSKLEDSRNVILGVPYEATTSYGSGTSRGPDFVLKASKYVELYDIETRTKPHTEGICYVSEFKFVEEHSENLKIIGDSYLRYFKMPNKFVVALGGEHSITIGIVNSLYNSGEKFDVLQFDAHTDLRARLGNSNLSHGCVMRRIIELGINTLQVGIRSMSAPEATFIEKNSLNVIYGTDFFEKDLTTITNQVLDQLGRNVYITFDVDFFNSSVIRTTGSPEPGGLDWNPTLALLKAVFENRHVIGMDIVEVAGVDEYDYSVFNVALLIKHVLAYSNQNYTDVIDS